MEKDILKYVKENKLEKRGQIRAMDLIDIANRFNTTVYKVMVILRNRQYFA